jgi:hypothetical protein
MKIPQVAANRPVIAYPAGAGGMWLGYLLWTLEKNFKQFPLSKGVNFHNRQGTGYYLITHNDSGSPVDFTFSGLCKFNVFLNCWIKYRVFENYQQFNEQSLGQQIYTLSNNARWFLSDVYSCAYEQKIDLDYKNIFLNTKKFRDQLLTLLSQHWPKEYINRVTQEYIDSAAVGFRVTAIDPAQHVGNIHSTGWLAWCHANCLNNSVEIPVNVEIQADEYKHWISKNQNWIIEKTQPYIL